MGLDTIEKEIVDITNKIALKKVDEARNKSEEIKKETEDKIIAENKQSDEETENLLEQMRLSFEALAKFEIKKTELGAKREIIEKVFEKTREKIESLDDKTLEKITKRLLEKAENEIEVETVYCNEKAKKWISKQFKIKTEDMLGGIMAETKDGKIRVDNRFEIILEEVRKDALKKIAKTVM